jgi:hypothetical protein
LRHEFLDAAPAFGLDARAMSTSTSAEAAKWDSPTAMRLTPPPIDAPTRTGRFPPSASTTQIKSFTM